MTNIDNTTEQMHEPGHMLGFLADSLADGGSATGPIERMEAAGQTQFIHSDRMPTDLDKAAFEAAGFSFGEPDSGDQLFMPATLPDGWMREGSDHAMWSYIMDQHGRKRASVFYKAAFYDRRAFAHLNTVTGYVRDVVSDGGEFVFDDHWATRDAVAAALAELRDSEREQAAEFREVGMTDSALRRDKESAAYATALKKLEDA